MKYILLSLLLTGCSSLDHFVCYGAGTCGRDGSFTVGYGANTGRYVSPVPTTITTNVGTYIITNNQSTGAIMSINRVSGGK